MNLGGNRKAKSFVFKDEPWGEHTQQQNLLLP